MGLKEAAEGAVKTCLNVKPGEAFLVITDTEKEEIGRALFNVALDVGAESIIVVMKPRTRHGEEPPKPIAEMWAHVDAFLVPTKFSLTHTQARKKATAMGARGATMPGITKEMFIETMNIDYNKVKEYVERMYRALLGAKKVEVASPLGTHLEASIEDGVVMKDTGILHTKGDFGNLPAGEVFVAPLEGTAEGTVVFDGSMAGIGILPEVLKIEAKDGYAVNIEGWGAERLKKVLEPLGKDAYNVAEIGLDATLALG